MATPKGATHKHNGNDVFNPHFIKVYYGNVFARSMSGLGRERWVPIKSGFGTEHWIDDEDQYEPIAE